VRQGFDNLCGFVMPFSYTKVIQGHNFVGQASVITDKIKSEASPRGVRQRHESFQDHRRKLETLRDFERSGVFIGISSGCKYESTRAVRDFNSLGLGFNPSLKVLA
jgi:hypothetical protein